MLKKTVVQRNETFLGRFFGRGGAAMVPFIRLQDLQT